MVDDALVEQPARLGAMFKKCRAEVDIEYMESCGVEPDIGSQTASRFTRSGCDVVVLINTDRQPSKYDVAVAAPSKTAGFTESEIETEFLGNKSRLVRLPIPAFNAQDLLKGNDICVNLTEHLGDPPRPDAPIQTSTFVNVVGGDSKYRVECGQFQNTTRVNIKDN
jgi:hypothetical protein